MMRVTRLEDRLTGEYRFCVDCGEAQLLGPWYATRGEAQAHLAYDVNDISYTDAVNDGIRALVDTDAEYMAAVRQADAVAPSGDPDADAVALVQCSRAR